MAIRKFELLNGKWTIKKDPDSKLIYSGNITDWLADAGSPIASVDSIPVGVTVSADSTGFQGASVYSRVEGLDVTDEEAINSLTWRVTLADGQTEDFSIFFTRADN